MTRLLYGLLLLATFLVALTVRPVAASIARQVQTEDDRYYLPPSAWLRVFCLGYNEASAIALWAKTLVYFGGRSVHQVPRADATAEPQQDDPTGFTIHYLNAVTDVDPRFRTAYAEGYTPMLFAKGVIDRETVQAAIDLTTKGLRYFPADGELAFNLGFLYYYDMAPFYRQDDHQEEERRLMQEGVHWFKKASLMPNAPEYAGTLSSTLLRRRGMDDLIVEHLKTMLLKETDPVRRRTLELHYEAAVGEAGNHDIELTRELLKRWNAQMPYAPFELYLMLTERSAIHPRDILDPLAESQALLMTDLAPDTDSSDLNEPY